MIYSVSQQIDDRCQTEPGAGIRFAPPVHRTGTTGSRSRTAFSLVEMLIIVVLMGILVAIVVPWLGNAGRDASYVGTIENLRLLREAIQLYRNQHNGMLPGSAESFPDRVFVEQLTLPTNLLGERSPAPDKGFGDPRYPFGPYLQGGRIPPNLFNNSNLVKTVRVMPDKPPGGNSPSDPGWIYELTTGRIRINYGGQTPDGGSYWEL